MKCPKCGCEYNDMLEACPSCYEPRPFASVMIYKERIHCILHHPIVLVIAILFSVFAFTYLIDLWRRPLLYIFPLLISALSATGCFLIWAKSQKKQTSSGHFGLAETLPLISYLFLFAVLILVIVVAIWTLAYLDKFDVGSVFTDSWVASLLGERISSSLALTMALGKTIYIFVFLALIAFIFFLMRRYSRFFFIYDAVSKSLDGYAPPMFVKSSYSILTWILSGILVFISFVLLPFDFTLALRILLYSTTMILFCILYNMYHKEIEVLYDQYRQEYNERKYRERAKTQAAPTAPPSYQAPFTSSSEQAYNFDTPPAPTMTPEQQQLLQQYWQQMQQYAATQTQQNQSPKNNSRQ